MSNSILIAARQWPTTMTKHALLELLVQIITYSDFKKIVTFKLEFNIWIPLSLILHMQLNYFVVAYNVKSLILPSVFYVTAWQWPVLAKRYCTLTEQMERLPKSAYFSCNINKHENTVYWNYATLQDVGVTYGTTPETV
jgi:hypothetical protein